MGKHCPFGIITGGKAGTVIDVKLSEELLCHSCATKQCNKCDFNQTRKAILYPMRTGNTYHEEWVLADGTSHIENHEYVVLCQPTLCSSVGVLALRAAVVHTPALDDDVPCTIVPACTIVAAHGCACVYPQLGVCVWHTNMGAPSKPSSYKTRKKIDRIKATLTSPTCAT